MAQGDITWYTAARLNVMNGVHNLNSNTIKVGLVTSTYTPAAGDADPRWGAGGGTNCSTNQVTPGGNYATGGPSIGTHQVQASGTSAVLTATSTLQIAQNASNPTNARWGIIYDDTATNKNCLAFIDLGSVRDLTTGPFTIDWGDSPLTNSILQITA